MKFERRSRYQIHPSTILLDSRKEGKNVLLQIRKGPVRRVEINSAATKILRLLHNGMTWIEIEKKLNLSEDRSKLIIKDFLIPLFEFRIVLLHSELDSPSKNCV